VALVKKVENDKESRDRCFKDLEVFLENNTTEFVNKLFDHLTTTTTTTTQKVQKLLK
jgi:predicted adenine nucleotide alpha hydrolase (AANH) superfamily ATPase